MKVISVCPAGRRRFLEILVPYLLRNRDVIHEHHWWLNTRDPGDVAYIRGLASEHPSFFRVVAKPHDPRLGTGANIWTYLRECVAPDTLYLRFDDDICYVAPDAIANLVRYRQEHRRPFLVLGNIVNNAVCTHFRQRAGIVPASWGNVANECMDAVGWNSGTFARRLHHLFLDDLEQGRHERWTQHGFPIDGTSRFSVNAISWFGADLAGTPEIAIDEVDEEPFLTADLPKRLGRPNEVCPDALFGHYAFYTQRDYLERACPEILARYRAIAAHAPSPTADVHPAVALLKWKAREARWHFRNGRRALKQTVNGWLKKSA